ncbi:hypothetical protein HanIR_Chr08g0353471 [Helianthus annuus]|nr:hypothetical protein HanIR_Chr08g0353471 [Helianthus annuus]
MVVALLFIVGHGGRFEGGVVVAMVMAEERGHEEEWVGGWVGPQHIDLNVIF